MIDAKLLMTELEGIDFGLYISYEKDSDTVILTTVGHTGHGIAVLTRKQVGQLVQQLTSVLPIEATDLQA